MFKGDLEGDLEGDLKGYLKGDFEVNLIWFSIELKFNSFELDSEVGRLVWAVNGTRPGIDLNGTLTDLTLPSSV